MIVLPKRRKGRQSPQSNAEYREKLSLFAKRICEIESTLDFKVSSRGWCYILEEFGLTKGDFDRAQSLINDCRKIGLLPVDITARDATRATNGIERLDYQDLEDECTWRIDTMLNSCNTYLPESFWEGQGYYLEVFVEKIDLVGLFEPVCKEFHIPITNVKGWSDIHSRVDIMRRFAERESEGKQCVLLYCGDFDPGGLNISQTLHSNFSDLALAAPWNPSNLIIDRFGLNFDFIEINSLSWVDNLETSSGKSLDSPLHADFKKPYVQDYLTLYGARKVEANALVVRVEAGRQLMRDAIEKYLNPDDVLSFESSRQESVNQLKMELNRMLR